MQPHLSNTELRRRLFAASIRSFPFRSRRSLSETLILAFSFIFFAAFFGHLILNLLLIFV